MTQLDRALERGLLILMEAWGKNHHPPKLPRPVLPSEDIGKFQQPSAAEVVAKLKQELGDLHYKQLIVQILSLDSKQKIVEFFETLGVQLPKGALFFYLEAVYVLLVFDGRMVRDNKEVRELLVTNLFSFGISQEAANYLLRILNVPLASLLPLLEKMIENKNWIVRGSVVDFFYGLHHGRFSNHHHSISKDQWRQIQALLEGHLKNEEHDEIRRLTKREITLVKSNSYVWGNTDK